MKKSIRENLTGYGFLLPNITGFLTFVFLPVFASMVLSFFEWDIFNPPEFTGISNYVALIKDTYFWKFLGNTLFFMISIPLGMAVSLLMAVQMNQKLRGIVFFRTVYFLPVVSSMVACALLWRWIYNPDFGLLNGFLKMLGVVNPPTWLSSTAYAKPAIILMLIWKGAGYNMLLYLAALQSIPDSVYEAAGVDGAGTFHKFLFITVPLLGPTHFFILIMSVIGVFQMFGEIFIMTGGGPAGATTTIIYYIYNNAFQWFKMGYASAISWVLFAMMFAVTLIQWKYFSGMRESVY
ncbi:MAG: sugar ABC transporter permease [Elusimicrobiota bacterium]